jgi:hypothetical protein
MLSRSTGTRKLMNNSNAASTVSNVSSVNINSAIANVNVKNGPVNINFPSFIAKTLVPVEKMEAHLLKKDDIASLKQGIVTNEMIERIKLKPSIVHAGSFMNKLRKTNKYKMSKRLIFKVCLIDKESYDDFGSKSNLYGKIGEIDRDSEMMNRLSADEVKFVNEIYNINETIPLNIIGNSSSNSGSSIAAAIPAAGNILSGIFTGGRRRLSRKHGKKVLFAKKHGKNTKKSRKTTKKSRKHKTRKH